MATNRYPATCSICGHHVPANAGTLEIARGGGRHRVWRVKHLACSEGEPRVITVDFGRYADGESYIRNARGRCEDAPGCGCCEI